MKDKDKARSQVKRLLNLSRHTCFTHAQSRSYAQSYADVLSWVSKDPHNPARLSEGIGEALNRMGRWQRNKCSYRNPDGLRCLNDKEHGTRCALHPILTPKEKPHGTSAC